MNVPSSPMVPGRGEEFFEELYRRQREPLLRLLYRLTGDWSTAEDSLHHAFTRLYEGRKTFDLSKPLKNLLVTIAMNHARNVFRNRTRREKSGTPPEASVPSPAGNKTDVESLIVELNSDERAVLVLYYYERFSYSEISEMLGLPLGTVKWKMHMAIQRLRGTLEARSYEL